MTFTPTPAESVDFNNATTSVLIDVTRAPLTVTVNEASKSYGQANPAFSVAYGGFVNSDTFSTLGGQLAFSTTAGTASDVNSYDVVASGLSSSDYSIAYPPGTLSITPADQTIAWSTPADITSGTPLGAAQLNATVSVPGPAQAGPLTYNPGAGTVLSAGSGQTLTVVAAATPDYNQATATVPINVSKQMPLFDTLAAPTIVYGTTSTTLSGHLAAGSAIPPGDASITLQQLAMESSPTPTPTPTTGTFSGELPDRSNTKVSSSPYTISYALHGDTNTNTHPDTDTNTHPIFKHQHPPRHRHAAASTTTHLTVIKATPTVTWANPARHH